MNKYYLAMILGILFASCRDEIITPTNKPVIKERPNIKEEPVTACGVQDPAKNIRWLAEFIATAERDTTTAYLGTIWLGQYEGQDFFEINMTLGDYGSTCNIFDCEGNIKTFYNTFSKREFKKNIKNKKLIYCKPIRACGITDPAHELKWLEELIEKADNDKKGCFVGNIWLENFKGNDFFITSMNLCNGGVMYWIFDCSGNHFGYVSEQCAACNLVGGHCLPWIEDEDFIDFLMCLRKRIVIYTFY